MRLKGVGIIAAAAVLVCMGVVGCRSGGGGAGGLRWRALRAEVAVPPGVPREQLGPFSGSAMERARVKLPEIAGGIALPDYLGPQAAMAADEAGDVPLAAQYAFVAGRQAWREQQPLRAITELEEALRLAPHHPEILRLLAEIHSATGNKAKAAIYLKQWVAAEPGQVEGLLVLGRFAMEQNDWPQAIAIFNWALTVAERSAPPQRTVRSLLHYLLAVALAQQGYAAAAIEQYGLFLEGPEQLTANSGAERELMFLQRQEGLVWQAMGDLHNQLNDPAGALAAYQQAGELGISDGFALSQRIVYSYLRLRQDAAAEQVVVELVRQSGGEAAALRLVTYLTENGVPAAELAEHLKAIYVGQDQPAELALAIAGLLPEPQSQAFLLEHVGHKPGDAQVFEQALRQMLAERSAEQLGRAVVLTAQAMAGAPQAAEDYAISLIRTAQDGVGLLGAIEALPAEQQQEPIMLVLQGTVQGSMGEVTEAQRLFEQALEAQPALTIARLQLVKLMIFQRNFEEAETLLAPLADRSDNSVVSLRVRVLTEKGQVAEALTLINEMIASGSADVPLLISKAQLQLQRGEVEAAEGTLLEALESRPDEERLYEALFDLYDPPGGVASPAADAPRQYQRLLRQILLTIPHSRIARLKRAQLHIAKGELQQGEGLLVGLAQEYPSDMKVLGSLLELYFRSNRGEQAQAILQEKLAAEPNNATLLMLAMRLYQGMGDADGVAQMQERLILLQPVSSARQQGLAVLYLRTKRPAEALAVLDEMLSDPAVEDGHELVGLASWALMDLERFDEAEARLDDAIEKYADHAADLSYQKAMVVRRRGDSARAEQVMMDTLRVHPDHPQTNNDLGYSWTVRHENLEQARAMIQKAVDVDPTSAAYLDSLGWVSYKLGRFEDAEKWLRRSRANGGESAVILDHLADAVYRLGQVQEAQQLWQAAQKLLPQVPVVDDPELVTLGDRLVVKLRAVQQDEVVPVAETAEVPEARAGEEPVGPQTQPASEPAAGVSEGPVDPALGPTTAPAQTQPVGR